MEKGIIQVFFGNGSGKSSAAIGNAIRAAGCGKTVYIVQFMKGQFNSEYMEKLEPEIKTFRFERLQAAFDSLTDEEKADETANIRNGLNFAHKVIATGECDLLILDEIFGIIDEGIVSEKEFISVLNERTPFTDIILTGRVLPKKVAEMADEIYDIEPAM